MQAKPNSHYWRFFTSHAAVLCIIKSRPGLTTSKIARRAGITERTAYKIIGELAEEGYVARRRFGRRNTYLVDMSAPLRHHFHPRTSVGDLISAAMPAKKRERQFA